MLLLSFLPRLRALATQRPLHRLRVVSLLLGSAAWPATGQLAGGWSSTPMLLWALAAGAVAAGAAVGARFLRGTSTRDGRWLHVPVFALSAVFALTLGSLMLWDLVAARA
ncbi:hypothetical protein [Nocardiopsis sp. FIRDI 009]|uniref:hypothetical protein n=1 Tax=Nocardiopsis sp. FIRDI 009 TaxID=714197 RepID=UPI0013002FFD|nr:hypothetical protein [Nocardiopsis sp. FIRDI 009]